MTAIQSEQLDLTSFSQLVQELIGGAVRRHTFTTWELDLLFDLQNSRLRKSARPDILRRYLKAVQQQFAADPSQPLRFSAYLEREQDRRRPPLRQAESVLVAKAHYAG